MNSRTASQFGTRAIVAAQWIAVALTILLASEAVAGMNAS